MSDKLERKRFGKYLILDHLLDGGIGTICRARFLGEQAAKVVAIKMVREQFSKDPSYKTMFMDEVKLTFGLIHPNIVQTYDYGMFEEQLYVAMEYCDGRNLKEYLDKLKQRKFVFPVEISVYITTQICQGLHYAHTYTDKLSGKRSNIIHRDISPHNIMLTYDGAVKIIDFGIAKSETNSESTQAGTIKGKLSYLAPEYLEGMELDARYDEFAVGITLWELLCSRKLFKANNDLAVLKKIQECKVPAPSTINPNVPKELDDIVLKALSKDRNKRFDDLEKMTRALNKFLYSTYPNFSASDLSYFAKELFKEEIRQDREKLFEFGKIDIDPYLRDMESGAKNGAGESKPEKTQQTTISEDVPVGLKKEKVLDLGFDKNEEKNSGLSLNSKKDESLKAEENKESLSATIKKRNKTINTRKSGRQSTRINQNTTGGDDEEKRSRLSRIGGKDLLAKRKNDKKSTLIGLVAMVSLIIGGIIFLGDNIIKKRNVRTPTSEIKEGQGQEQEQESELAKDKEGSISNTTEMVLRNIDKSKHSVYINGEKVEFDHLGKIQVPKEKFWLRVQKVRHEHFVKEVNPLQDERVLEIPETVPTYFGFLSTSYDCLKGEIYFRLYGERRIESVPITSKYGIPLPVAHREKPSEYKMIFVGKSEKKKIRKRISFEVNADSTVDLCKKVDP